MRLKEQLLILLKHHGMTSAQLCRKCGVKTTTMSDWLRGRSPRDLDQVKKVADTLRVTVDHLLWGEGPIEEATAVNLHDLLSDDWTSGIVEIRIRRAKGR